MSIGHLIPYLNVAQACESLGVDKHQLLSIIRSRKTRWYAFIDDKKPALAGKVSGHESFNLYEMLTNEKFTSEEADILCGMSEGQLASEGYSVKSLPDPNFFLIEKDSKTIVIKNVHGEKTPVHTNEFIDDIPVEHDGFIELCDDSFTNPDNSLATLFCGEECEIFQVRCDTPGRARHLNTVCRISLQDIYFDANEICQIGSSKSLNQPRKQLPKQTLQTKNTSMKRKRLERFVTHLVYDSQLDTYGKFCDAMKNEYLSKDGRPNDSDVYNDHDEVRRVYATKSRSKNDSIKINIHYSTINNADDLIPQKPYALTSFNRIFTAVRSRISKESDVPESE